MKAELVPKPNKVGKHEETRPKFKIKGNNKYQLNKNVLNDLRNELLEEGEQLLTEHKHICIAEKYGWDTVECYTTDPIASDSDDESTAFIIIRSN